MESIHEGLEGGYSDSPMAKLHLDFDRDSEHNVSTYALALLLATKTTLNPEDIEDRGVSKSSNVPQFALSNKLYIDCIEVINELQEMLIQAAKLEWESDPKEQLRYSWLLKFLEANKSVFAFNVP
jgi:hypothetical protein